MQVDFIHSCGDSVLSGQLAFWHCNIRGRLLDFEELGMDLKTG